MCCWTLVLKPPLNVAPLTWKSPKYKDTKIFCEHCEIEKQISGCGSLVNCLVLQPKGLDFVQLLSKSLEVPLKNAKHKITNKLKAVTLFFSKNMHYIRQLKAYVNWKHMSIIVLFWQGKYFKSPLWNWRGQSVFIWLPYDCPPCFHPRLHVCTPVLQRSSTICQKAHYQVQVS